jgi:malonate transporter and related proteins
LFATVAVGYAVTRLARLPERYSDFVVKACFTVFLPALLFRLMSEMQGFAGTDARLLAAFFGSCVLVFAAARVVSARWLHLDGVGQSVFAVGGIFSNNVLLGLPLAQVLLGEAAIPSVALVIVFNSLLLWTLVTVSVEWARHGALGRHRLGATVWGVLKNPIVASILGGAIHGRLFGPLPPILDEVLVHVGRVSGPLALVALGMGLAHYEVRRDLRTSLGMCAFKLVVQPAVVLGLALAFGLPSIETQAVVLLASMAIGTNVYLMARQFGALQSAVASGLVWSTVLAMITTPLWVLLVQALG